MSAFQYDDSTKTGFISCKIRKVKISPCVHHSHDHSPLYEMGGAKRKTLLLTKLLYKFTLKKLFKRHSAASDGANIWVFSQGHPWARQMAHVKWKTVALPRLLGYVPRRLSDFQSWLSSKKKGKSPIPGEKKMQPTSGHA